MTLEEQIKDLLPTLVANDERLDIWANGDETAEYTASDGTKVPSIRKLLAEKFKWQGAYTSGVDYTEGQTFEEGNAVYLVTSNFTSTDFASDAANYSLMFSFDTFVTACLDAQTAAEAAQALAEAALDEFTDQYLGAKSSAPATDNDGDFLTDGDVYYNTIDKKAYVWDTDEWLDFRKATAWGELTGTLANQTDLQAALNGKSSTSHTHTESDVTDLDKYTQAEVDALLAGLDTSGGVYSLTSATTPAEVAASPANSVWIAGRSGTYEVFQYFVDDPNYKTFVNVSKADVVISTTESGLAETATIKPFQSVRFRYVSDDFGFPDYSGIHVDLLTSTGQKINISLLPTGTTSGTVAVGNHTHTKDQVGLGNVDNTSDTNKPVSTAQQSALDGKSDTGHNHSVGDLTDIIATPVFDATERLALGTPAGTYVEETKTPNVIFFQTGADASDSSSWIAIPHDLFVGPPATASSTGSPNQIAYDNNYFYVCVATNTWLRAPLATW